jgi:hypothetical protein
MSTSLNSTPPRYEQYVEVCLKRTGEDDPEGKDLLRGRWEEMQRDVVLESLKAGCGSGLGGPQGTDPPESSSDSPKD